MSKSLICCHSYNWDIVPHCCLILFSRLMMMLKISFNYFVGHCHFLFCKLSICISSTFPFDSVLLICTFLCILGKNPFASYMIYRYFLPIWGRCYFDFPLQVELWYIISWCHYRVHLAFSQLLNWLCDILTSKQGAWYLCQSPVDIPQNTVTFWTKQ